MSGVAVDLTTGGSGADGTLEAGSVKYPEPCRA
jgi:hypothetical protein